MSVRKELEIGLQFGDVCCRLFKFIVNEVSGDLYVVIRIPEVGLHLSVHPAKYRIFPGGKAHWKSDKLGIEEDVDASFFSPEFWRELLLTYQESLGWYQPSGDEDVTVLQTNLLAEVVREEVLRRREITTVDVGLMMQTIREGTFYRTKEYKLPLLVQEMERKNPSLCRDLSILALTKDRMIVPISSETMIEFNHLMLTEKLRRTSLDFLFNPMQKAIDKILRIYPDAFHRWFPTSDIENFFKESMKSLEQSKPKIIDF